MNIISQECRFCSGRADLKAWYLAFGNDPFQMLQRKVEKRKKKFSVHLANCVTEELSCAAAGMESACDFNPPIARESPDPSFRGSSPALRSKRFPHNFKEAAQVLGFATVPIPSKQSCVICFHAASKSARILLSFCPSLWASVFWASTSDPLHAETTTHDPAAEGVQVSSSFSAVPLKVAPEEQRNHHL